MKRNRIVYWDLLVLLLIFTSLVIITFEIAFVHSPGLTTSIIIYLIDGLLIAELFLFRSQSKIENTSLSNSPINNQLWSIRRFQIDLLANFPLDVIALIAINDVYWAGASIVLWIRMIRLLRIPRVMRIIRRWEYMPDTNTSVVRVSRFLIGIAFMTHLVSCAWYYSSYITSFIPESWVSRMGMIEASLTDLYIRSIYWTITTMTSVGYGDITPAWRAEYIIAMMVMLMGAYVYAYIIGNVASLLSNLDAAKAGYRQRMAVISQFLKLQRVPSSLSDRVHEYYELSWKRNKGLHLDNIFMDLPKPLMTELTEHIALPILSDIPFFKNCTQPLQAKLMSVLRFETYPPNTIVGKTGQLGDAIYFIRSGEIEVLSEADNTTITSLKAKDHFGELSMLLREKRTATTRTMTLCEVLVLDRNAFQVLKDEFPEIKTALSSASGSQSVQRAELLLENIVL